MHISSGLSIKKTLTDISKLLNFFLLDLGICNDCANIMKHQGESKPITEVDVVAKLILSKLKEVEAGGNEQCILFYLLIFLLFVFI